MSYKHILVAVDLSSSSEFIVAKAVSLAKDNNAAISLIYVDVDYADNFTGLSYSEFSKLEPVSGRSILLEKELQALAEKIDYPITNTLFVSGDLNKKLQVTVKEIGADLLVCGHHHDFWSRLLSSVRKLVNSSLIDMLIVQL
ncbi:universal stress protein [Psychromonas sp. MB-3u-54]|uniref:universal stress protein n=1 Tax=Psychromonas sp. MB-3u-54 TaxID=2058319 RepID=UPI000C31D29E|nr:universal stress protein [Psychromonas sp. MB-3u-54]PKH02681.1 universal stress protein [Psychromonas sp. MB-3u-54]